uniref:Rap-GAP domain-containing protein n=1 Tax=Eptatretus burgeri TaxID=7764 RepID=A0A8C4QVG0_EPTBU
MSSFDDRDLLYGVKLKRDGGNVGFVPNRSESFQARANGVPKMGVRAWVSPHLTYDTRATVTGVVRDWDKAEDIPYKNANGGEGHTMPIRGSRRRPQLFQQDLFLQQPPSTLRQRSNSDIALSELDVEVTSISGSVPKNTTMSGVLHREYGSTSSIESRTVCTGNTRWFLPAHRGQSKTGFLEVLNSTPPGKTASQDGLDEVGFEGAQAILARRKDRRSKSDAGDQSILLKRRSKGGDDMVKAEGVKSQDNAGTENRLLVCRRAFAHFDVQSVIFGLLGSPDESCASMYARNMSTGASAASQSAKGQLKDTTMAGSSLEELNLKQEEECHDHGDGKSNEIVKSCPFFRNELGGEGERQVGLSRANAGCVNSVGIRPTIELPLYYCRTNCSLSVLEGPRDGNLLRREKPKRYVIEHVDLGARYYRDYFYGRDHQNYFGVDEGLGPLALSICREKVEESGDAGPEYSYRLIVRTRELCTLRGSVPEPVVPSTSRHGTTRGLPHRDILEYAVPDLPLSALKLAQATPHVTDQLLRLDEQGLSYQHKIGIMYCKTGQSTEEEMYNNEVAGPAFDEFLDMLGERVRLKGFDKYRAQLDNKMDSTGTHSLYTLHGDYEIMFHVSTMLPHTPNNRQQLLRKRHIGNDIVTIVFQEAGALPFTPQHIRSQFQHVFIVVRAHDPCTEHTTYSLAVARSRDVPVFGPPFPSGARFSRSHAFRDFLLAKAINGENAAHKAEKFVAMATRTRLEYMRELAEKHVTAVALAEPSASVLGALISWGGRRKEKVAAQSDIMLNTPGCLAWSVVIQDYSSGTNMDCLLAVSSAYVALIEQCSRTLVFHCSCQDILGWSSSEQSLKLFYGRGECIVMPHIHEDDVKEFVQRLQGKD